MYVSTDAVTVSLNEMNIVYFVNQFTMINILSNFISHAEFFDSDSFMMKFMITDSQSAFSAFSLITLSYLLSLWILFLQHESHLATYSVIQFLRSLMLHLLHTRFSVHLTSRCLSALLLWHTHMSSSSVKKVFFTLYVAAKSLVRVSSLFLCRISVWIIFTFSWSECLLKVSASLFLLPFL